MTYVNEAELPVKKQENGAKLKSSIESRTLFPFPFSVANNTLRTIFKIEFYFHDILNNSGIKCSYAIGII